MLIRLSLYTLLLCLVPLFTLTIGWHWQENMSLTRFDYLLYLITETGSVPYAIITCGFFALIYFVSISNKKQAILVIITMAFSVVLTQGIKSGLKTVFAEPRPFISAISEHSNMMTEYFYDQSKEKRANIVQHYYHSVNFDNVPSWLVEHRAKETGYSFPSGHTIFAVTWLLLATGFSKILGRENPKLKWITAFISIWAILMLVSRLRLGMHYPIDLLTSTIIAWLVHIGLFYCIIHFTSIRNKYLNKI
ncbi:phosphatidylglycerophosphatase [Bisgaardia hudsonensis]|uniref:undecaprenyl-diphosphate phosphatase n=1 Tax=Bisgaardia hudsonensis TaxID=109472 RepID=A0A4R2N1M3_9PAST|nr:phosphatase PAP2 family protein [Bisgaardia hudsonensis]QLB12966.1 hypothetical protein A6A11_04755 [Bisgaardia hudsonensis]TCP13472.1 phosphatidylglycerophosphatase [Bisgaardia hudsonensis]